MNAHRVTLEGIDLGIARRALEEELHRIHAYPPSEDYTALEKAEDEADMFELAATLGRLGDERASATLDREEAARLRPVVSSFHAELVDAGWDETSDDPSDWANQSDSESAYALLRRLS